MSEEMRHHPSGDDRFYGEKGIHGLKPLAGIFLAILALPLFLAVGLGKGLRDFASTVWDLGDDFYYWSKIHYWGKYTPRYRRWVKSQQAPEGPSDTDRGGEAK